MMHPSWHTDLPLLEPDVRRAAKRWRKRLSMQEHYALQRYAGSAFSAVNSQLRGDIDPRAELVDADAADKARTLHEVLSAIEPFDTNNHLTVWRGSALPDSLLDRGRWTDAAWVSCSFDADHARFAATSSPENETGTLLQLNLDPGCRYLPLSFALFGSETIANEHEILLLPGHRFRVESDGPVMTLRVWGPWEL